MIFIKTSLIVDKTGLAVMGSNSISVEAVIVITLTLMNPSGMLSTTVLDKFSVLYYFISSS